MKKAFLFIWAAICLTACGLGTYRDELNELHSEVDELKMRLDELCEEVNTNMESLTAILEAIQKNDFVKSIVPIKEGDVEIGYVITFSQSGSVTIYHGERGSDGHTPVVGVLQGEDGMWYWTIDGVWLTDEDGNKVRATGPTGVSGSDGQDGATPQLKIEEGYWYISLDNGATWQYVGQATGDKGDTGETGPQGDKGDRGEKGDSMFSSVDYTSDPNYLILTLADGVTKIYVPTKTAFEDLSAKVAKANEDIKAMQAIVSALQGKDYVQSVTELSDGSGYVITFTKSGSVTIYHGTDGEDGEDGAPGQDGTDGKDGHTPIVSVKQDTDGVWYWVIDGEWLLDASGNKVVAAGRDGNDGQDGENGKDGQDGEDGQDGAPGEDGADGVTPQLKIENGYWYVTYDDGATWKQLGKATGEKGEQGDKGDKGDSFFNNVTYNSEYVYIVLKDNTVLTIPRATNYNFYSNVNETSGRGVKLSGKLTAPSYDLPYSRILVYYSEYEYTDEYSFNIYNAKVATCTSFDSYGYFDVELSGLKYDTTYDYCVVAEIKDQKIFGGINNFTTWGIDYSSPYDATDLSNNGTANCYIVTDPGKYCFRINMGNSDELVGRWDDADEYPTCAEVVWESFGRNESIEEKDLIQNVEYSETYITFETAEYFREGNALIAIRNAKDEIIWSWHIWITDQPMEQIYYNDAGVMMDRNLGAVAPMPEEEYDDRGTHGLLYQWGRKDPFLGLAESTISWPYEAVADAEHGTIEYATSHPTQFIKVAQFSKYHWLYEEYSDYPGWQSSKTIYDPCPVGWRVPDGGSDGIWCKALGGATIDENLWDDQHDGINFSGKFGDDEMIWYPAPDYRTDGSEYNYTDNIYAAVYWGCNYWSPALVDCLEIWSSSFNCCGDAYAYYGASIRCQKE